MKKIFSLILILIVGITSCKKGDTGVPGKDGNANVKTMLITTNSASWQRDNSSKGFTLILNDSDITSDIVNTGSVLVYMQVGNQWTALSTSIPSGTYDLDFIFSYYIGSVEVDVAASNFSSLNNPGALQFKIVAIASN